MADMTADRRTALVAQGRYAAERARVETILGADND